MADQGAIKAGRAFVELFADDSRLRRDLQRASARLKAWGEGITAMGAQVAAAGAAILAPLVLSSAAFASMGAELAHASERTGVAVEKLSALQYAAEQVGLSFEDLETDIRKMQKSIFSVTEGSDKARMALARLGIGMGDLMGKDPAEQLAVLSDGFAKLTEPAERSAIAIELLGKSGTKLLPFFAQGRAGIEGLTQEAARLGLVMSGDDAKAAVELERAFNQLKYAIKYVAVTIGSALTPALIEGLKGKVEWVTGIKEWLRENKGLLVSLLQVAKVLVPIGLGLMVLGTVVSTIGGGLGALTSTVIGLLSVLSRGPGVLTAVINSVVGLGAGLVSTLLGILSPTTLVLAAVAGIGYAFIAMSDNGPRAIDAIKSAFGQMSELFGKTWGGIVDALKAGELGLAMKVAWAGAKGAWQIGVGSLKIVWLEFKNWFLDIWDDTVASFAISLNDAMLMAKKAWEAIKHPIDAARGTLVVDTTEHDATEKGILEDAARNKAAREAAVAKERAGLTSGGNPELDAAKRELDAVLEEIKRKKEEREKAAAGAAAAITAPGGGSTSSAIFGPSSGTFSAAAAQLMTVGGGTNWAEVQANVLKELRDLAQKQLDQLEQLGVVA